MKYIMAMVILTSNLVYSAEVTKCAPCPSKPKLPVPQNLLPSQPNLRQQASIFLYNDANAILSAKTSRDKTSGAIAQTKYKPAKKSSLNHSPKKKK